MQAASSTLSPQEARQAVIARLEQKSKESPLAYKTNVGLRALLGFAILLLLVALTCALIFSLLSIPFLLWIEGFHQAFALLALGKYLFLLVIPIFLLVKSALSALLTRFPKPAGTEVRRSDAPALFAALDDMRERLRGPAIHHVLIDDSFNAAAIQRPLLGMLGPCRNYIVLGLPLLESLSTEEALAVVAHEYGHLVGGHSHFGSYVYRLRLSWMTLQILSLRWTGFAANTFRKIVDWYVPYFNTYSFVLARSNEYQADAASALLVGKETVASALVRIEVLGQEFNKFSKNIGKAVLTQPTPPDDFYLRWADQARASEPEDMARWYRVSMQQQGDVADTHPPLKSRLYALLGDATPAPPTPLESPTAAQKWLTGSIQLQVQAHWSKEWSTPWTARHADVQEQREQLEKMLAVDTPPLHEFLKRLNLQAELELDADFERDVQACKSAFPESGLPAFLHGRWLLIRGQEQGIAELEQAMRLDSDLTGKACELAYNVLLEREDARAAEFHQRMTQHLQWEETVEPQRQKLHWEHELQAPADVSDVDRNRIDELMQIHRDGIARAYLAKRVLPIAPEVKTYVIALELEMSPIRHETPEQIIRRLVTTPWPVHILFYVAEGKLAGQLPRFKALANGSINLTPRTTEAVA